MSDIPAEGLRFIASAVRRGANPPGVPALLDEAAAELTRLRADLAQLEQESDAEISALRACLAQAEADLAAAQEREQRVETALRRIATPEAFFVATSNIDPEALGRMIYAQAVLGGASLDEAAAKAEAECKRRAALGEPQ